MKHELKTINPYFTEVWEGRKTYEFRNNDRNFQQGDTVVLKEYDSQAKIYSGREKQFSVGYILSGYGVPEGFVIISLIPTTPEREREELPESRRESMRQNAINVQELIKGITGTWGNELNSLWELSNDVQILVMNWPSPSTPNHETI